MDMLLGGLAFAAIISGNSRRPLPFIVRGNAAGWKRPPYRISIIAKCSLARKIDCGGLPSHNPLQVRTK